MDTILHYPILPLKTPDLTMVRNSVPLPWKRGIETLQNSGKHVIKTSRRAHIVPIVCSCFVRFSTLLHQILSLSSLVNEKNHPSSQGKITHLQGIVVKCDAPSIPIVFPSNICRQLSLRHLHPLKKSFFLQGTPRFYRIILRFPHQPNGTTWMWRSTLHQNLFPLSCLRLNEPILSPLLPKHLLWQKASPTA